MLEEMTTALVADLGWASGGGEVKLLKYLTEPFTKIVIQVISLIIYVLETFSLNSRYSHRHCQGCVVVNDISVN